MSQSNLPPAGDTNVSSPSDDEKQSSPPADPEHDYNSDCPEAGVQQPLKSHTRSAFASRENNPLREMPWSCQIILSCFVFWCCGPGCFCGLAAYFFAIAAQSAGEGASLRQYASVGLSILGIITGIGFIVVLAVILVHHGDTIYDTYVETYCPFLIAGYCYMSRRNTSSWFTCAGDYHFADGYCYYPSHH